ncbi:hypothetical protein KY289_020593 [Solanum tuberosum]|nr:hypothetical protein KY284_024911 [Solanum tuberosum]KAH0682841.1 hypothetical protein KY289_020593 [Solanum tuberosum]
MMILYLVFLVIFAFLFIKFLTADGDFTLLSKGKVKREEIEDKVIWITGASRGIGEILAKQLASLGAKLIISARNEAELQHVKQQLTGKYAPRDVMVLPLDLTSGEESLRLAVEKAESFFDAAGVDYMIHNAAYERPKSTALDVTEETLKSILGGEAGVLPITYLGMPSGVKSKSVEIWDGERKGYQLVKWKTVITEKRVGGLGIKNMKNQSKALRMKWLWKYSNDNQNMWGSVIKENYEESDSWMTKEVTTP